MVPMVPWYGTLPYPCPYMNQVPSLEGRHASSLPGTITLYSLHRSHRGRNTSVREHNRLMGGSLPTHARLCSRTQCSCHGAHALII